MEKYGIAVCQKSKEKNKDSCIFDLEDRSNLQIGVNRFKKKNIYNQTIFNN